MSESKLKIPNITILQSTFFVSNTDISDKLSVANKIRGGLSDILNGDPTILPIPDDAPPIFPRIILNSVDKTFSCNVSAERVDLVNKISKGSMSEAIEGNEVENKFLRATNDLAKLIIESLEWRVYRLSLISQFEIVPEVGAIDFLRQMVDPNFGKDAKELQLHKLRNLEVTNLKSNHWLRLITQSTDSGEEKLMISSDLNTLQTEKYPITVENSRLFFEEALKISKESS